MALPTPVLERLKLIAEQTRHYSSNPRVIPFKERTEIGLMLAVTFSEFEHFAYVGMQFFGFTLTPMQADIAREMQYGERLQAIMAQRGEAKSTLAALYAVWKLMQRPSNRILVVSAGETQASEVATLIIRLIEQWHLLCWLKADSSRGDRTSYSGYDVHCDLKGLDKSPSVACVGITASLNGKRADLLLADDIETTLNGFSATEREKVIANSKEFSAICTHGEIMYLGTPQTRNSVYNTLESRGFKVLVWCGRIPSEEQERRYGPRLAPYIQQLIEEGYARTGFGADGTLGQSTDPYRYDEATLVEKELDWGPEGFQLQYMLDTSMSDELRTRIKLEDLIVFDGTTDMAPDTFTWTGDKRYLVEDLPNIIKGFRLYTPYHFGSTPIAYTEKLLVVDPAGCGGDEMSYAAGGAASSYIHLFTVGGLRGGVSTENIDAMIDLCIELDLNRIQIESNMGHGTVTALFVNRLRERKLFGITCGDFYNTQQKERRIIDTVSPVTRRHRLIVHRRAIDDDAKTCEQYSREKRNVYSAFKQMADITYERGCLAKDDRIDAISMLVRELAGTLVVQEDTAAEEAQAKQFKEFMANPLDTPEYSKIHMVEVGLGSVQSSRENLKNRRVQRRRRQIRR